MSRPILVHGNDLLFHYCKYHRFSGQAYRLYKEWLIASFIPLWGFHSSPVQLLKVLPEHLPDDLGINKAYFDYPCFALQQATACTELDKQTVEILLPKLISDTLKTDFIKLCFFDIWVANEDRSHNNYNILLIRKEEHYELFPIDHEACFNHGELKAHPHPITYEESLIYSEAFAKLFKPDDLTSSALAGYRHRYYLCMAACKQHASTILQAMPKEWGINETREQAILARFLFDDQWFNEAWETFLDYIRLYLEHIRL